jgi:hypothetical protein
LVRNYLWYPPGAIAFKDGKYLGAGTIAESAKAYHDGLAKYTSIPWYPGVGLNDKIEDKLKQLYDRIVLWKTTPEERKAKQNQGG